MDPDDAVASAERFMSPADVVECRRDVFIVFGVLVRKHLRGRRISGSTGRIAVDLLDLGRPLPVFVGKVEAPPADPLGSAAG